MNSNRFYILYLLILISGISCQEKKDTTQEVPLSINPSDTIALSKLVGLKPKLRLTPEAQKATENWEFYQEISQTLDSLEGNTIGQTRTHMSRINTAYDNLKKQLEAQLTGAIPAIMNTQPIQARLAALETQLKVLRNELSKNEPIPERITLSIVQSKNALQDLNLQIDERFALSIEEMLEAANETQDSLTSTQPIKSVQLQPTQN